jgi:hypothetical protein
LANVSLAIVDTCRFSRPAESAVKKMANAITSITRQFSKPYLTLTEFKNAPTALDYGNLVVGGNQAAQDAELTNAITRASSYIDQYCNQILGATLDTEQQRVRIRPDGTIRFHPKYFPIVALTAFSYGYTPLLMNQIPDCSIAWIEEQEVIVPYTEVALNQSSQGPLGFGYPSTSRAETYINYTYVNGWANTTTNGAATAGATTITLSDGLGITAGCALRIFDGASSEIIQVASSYVYGSATVPLTAPLAFNHADGISVSNLPAAIKEAAILMTSAYLKIRGDASLVLDVTTSPGQQIDGSQKIGNDIAHVQQILKPFVRIR